MIFDPKHQMGFVIICSGSASEYIDGYNDIHKPLIKLLYNYFLRMTEFLYESKVAITKPKFDIFVLAFAVLLLMFKSQRILWVRPIPEIIIVVFGIAVFCFT